MKILHVPLRELDLPSDVLRLAKSFKPYSYFKGGAAREALLRYFTPKYLNRAPKKILDYDFVVFASDHREDYFWDHWEEIEVAEKVPILTGEERDECYRPDDLGDAERHWDKEEYFKTRDSTLNQVLLGRGGLYFTEAAKKSSCEMSVGLTEDLRPRAILRNVLFALRYSHRVPSVDIKKALGEAQIIDQLVLLFKAYKLGLEDPYYRLLAKHSREIRSDSDVDFYLLRLLEDFKRERRREFIPREREDRLTIEKARWR